MLMAVPNVSEGVSKAALEAISEAFRPARVLDIHSDADHNRAVFTLASEQGHLAAELANGTKVAHQLVSLEDRSGVHPHVGAVDVVPVVYLRPEDRGAACAEALLTAHLIAERCATPVFLYGELAGGRERAELREGGLRGLAARMADGQHLPDFGPKSMSRVVGATLVSARPPMVAFNLVLDGNESLERAKEIAAELRESGGGLPGVRAIGLWLDGPARSQVSCNVHDPFTVPLAEIVGFVRERAAVESAELVGLAPRAAIDGFPHDLKWLDFDPTRHVVENALGDEGVYGSR